MIAIIMVVGPITGASLNPARAFGPELVSALGRRCHALEPAAAGVHPARPGRRGRRCGRLRLPGQAAADRRAGRSRRSPIPIPARARPRRPSTEERRIMAVAQPTMKKFLNDPADVVKESLAGLAAAHGDLLRYDAQAQIVVRADAPGPGQGRAGLGRRVRARAAARRVRRAAGCWTRPARARCSPRPCPTRCWPRPRRSTAAPGSCTSSRTTPAT